MLHFDTSVSIYTIKVCFLLCFFVWFVVVFCCCSCFFVFVFLFVFVLFVVFASNLGSSGRSYVGSFFPIENQKRLARDVSDNFATRQLCV